ncbi:transcription factor VOZ1-like [Phragmites australis]|uniref:transcription factor VOZ1-like n=1 Tax=Phragmites australis TaxID=29695 RepID=UPI002D78BFDF|nr:transcription factor VOZ1-like [Phragmites australis]
MAGDPAAGAAHPASGGKGSRSSMRHRQFRDRAKTRVDDLQEMFSGLQSARKESRSADAAVLEEQVHQMLREWRAELSVPSPASSLQNSQGGNREASDPPSETLRLLQLALTEEEDDATSKLVVPRSPLQVPASHQSHEHEHGQDGRMPYPDQQCDAVAGGAAPAQRSLTQGAQGDCGEVAAVADAMFNDQMYYIDHELSIDYFLRDDDYKINLPGSNQDHFNNLHTIGQLEHQQFNLPLDLPPSNSCVDANNSVQDTGDVFVHMSDLLATMCPSPSQYLGPKCALWDCGRPVGGSEECQDYCNPYHAGLALNDDGLGTRPVMRPRGIDLKDGTLFTALVAKVQGKNVGIPVCEGAATSKSPWNAPELFDLSLLEGESLREWLFFDTPRRAFESGNRKQRSLPDYSGRGWHESRKQVMKDFGGLKRSYYMDPQPSSNFEWHLFEYEINDSDALALYRLEFKSSDAKRSAKTKLASSSLNEIQQQMVRLTADSPVENKRTARSKPKANQKDNNANVYPALNNPNQASAPNAYQAVPQANQMTFLNENIVYGPHLPHSENDIYGPHLPHGYSTERSNLYWNPSDGT